MRSLQFESLFKALPPALIIRPDSPAYTLIDANEAYFRATGSEPQDIIGKSIFEAFPNDPVSDRPVETLYSSINWVIEHKKAHTLPPQQYSIPIRGVQKFTQKRWIITQSPVLDANGELLYICQTSVDSEDESLPAGKYKAPKTGTSKRKLLHSLFMQAPVGIGVFLGEHYVVDLINPALARLYGKTPEELMKKPIFDVLTTARGMGFEQFLDNVRLTGRPYIGTEAMLPLIRDGHLENVFTNFVYEPFRDEKENIIGVAAIAVDVTKEVLTNRKLQESEQRLNMALQNSEAGVFDSDLISRKTIHSLRNAQIFGYPNNNEEWTVEKFLGHVHPDDLDRIVQEYQDSLKHGNVELTFRIIRTDGVVRWVHLVGKHIFNKDNIPVRCVGTTTDITDRKELERQKDQFISMVSHEIKTPLTSIKAYSELLGLTMKNDDHKKNHEFLSRMQSQINRLEGLIKDLLDISRMENGKLALNKTSFELNVMLEDLIKDLQLTNPTHKLILSQNDEASVVADRDKLIQVVTNLLNNAVKYSPNADEIHIALRCHQNQVICSVQDFGVGISPEKHHTIFERFQQANDVQQFSGLGLGLYIAREIIHAEGGEIWLESILGKGSIFYFTLPADKTRCD